MAKRYVFIRRSNDIIPFEIAIISILSGILSVVYFNLPYGYGFLIAFVSICILGILFMSSRVFRYIFAVLFSLAWSAGAFILGEHIGEKRDTVTAVVFAILALAISLLAHRSNFRFINEAEVVESD